MTKIRVRFKKIGKAKYISHLDLNRLFIRALSRSRLPVMFSQGFNPHPYIVFGPPISLGYEGEREVLDFGLEEDHEPDFIKKSLSETMPEGIVIDDVYQQTQKLSEISWSHYNIEIETGTSTANDDVIKLKELFSSPSICVLKRSKRSEREIDIAGMIKKIEFSKMDNGNIFIDCILLCSTKDNLNPEYVIKAATDKITGFLPKYICYKRIDLLNADLSRFI